VIQIILLLVSARAAHLNGVVSTAAGPGIRVTTVAARYHGTPDLPANGQEPRLQCQLNSEIGKQYVSASMNSSS
jgi:hypothetical protein